MGGKLGKDVVAEHVLSGMCLLPCFVAAVGVVGAHVFGRMDFSPQVDASTVGVTLLLLGVGAMTVHVARDVLDTRRAASMAARTRYVVTDRRIIVARPDDMGDTIVERSQIATTDFCHASPHGVHFVGPDNVVKIAFNRLPDPDGARAAIVAALARPT